MIGKVDVGDSVERTLCCHVLTAGRIVLLQNPSLVFGHEIAPIGMGPQPSLSWSHQPASGSYPHAVEFHPDLHDVVP
jgi:hypothetical protein